MSFIANLFKSPKAPKPDENIGLAQKELSELAVREQEWYESVVWPQLVDLQARSADAADRQNELQEELQRQQIDASNYYMDRFQQVQAPLEDRIIQEALDYNTKAEGDRRIRQAQADVSSQFGMAREQLERQLARQGVNPGSPAAIAAMRGSGLDEARAKAFAAASVRDAAEQIGWSRQLEASALARGLPGFQSQSAQLAGGLGMNAMQAGLAPLSSFNQNVGTMAAGTSNQLNAWGKVGQMGLDQFNIQSQNYRSQLENNPLNSILGAATGVATGWGLSKF